PRRGSRERSRERQEGPPLRLPGGAACDLLEIQPGRPERHRDGRKRDRLLVRRRFLEASPARCLDPVRELLTGRSGLPSTTNRRTKFSSSRTFPGQEYASINPTRSKASVS